MSGISGTTNVGEEKKTSRERSRPRDILVDFNGRLTKVELTVAKGQEKLRMWNQLGLKYNKEQGWLTAVNSEPKLIFGVARGVKNKRWKQVVGEPSSVTLQYNPLKVIYGKPIVHPDIETLRNATRIWESSLDATSYTKSSKRKGRILIDQSSIMEEAVKFYKGLLGSDMGSVSFLDPLKNFIINRITPEAVRGLVEDIIDDEINATVFAMNEMKALGPDGLNRFFPKDMVFHRNHV
ncbi:hypothetical protein K2173_023566 [Erythroxylum novogranatense]|uniref:Uncharacterized protein n=1 Tax=Erythroxylum novogranatense TaxID=1862640 RepID=A0AAV8TP57_9ROSI|nr:hypothetical protein K2173_023566 [Erythroxylum novogranatense]